MDVGVGRFQLIEVRELHREAAGGRKQIRPGHLQEHDLAGRALKTGAGSTAMPRSVRDGSVQDHLARNNRNQSAARYSNPFEAFHDEWWR